MFIHRVKLSQDLEEELVDVCVGVEVGGEEAVAFGGGGEGDCLCVCVCVFENV